MSSRDLEGRKIIVTGAASGMGRAIAELFGKNGAQLFLIDINEDGLDALSIGNSHKAKVDMADLSQVSKVADMAAEAMGGLDGLVNAAGILRTIPFADTDPATYHQVLSVNLHGPYFLCQGAIPHMQQTEAASIVNISSLAGLIAPVEMSAYAASKGGMLAFSRVMAAELGPRIRVNCIAPGVINTAMTQGMVNGSVEAVEEMGAVNPLRRAGKPEEVAELAMFLASSRSSFITGTTTAIDGGSSWH